MKQQKRRLPLFWQMMIWTMLSCFVLLSVSLGVTLRYSLVTAQTKIDEILQSAVQTLAETTYVEQMLRDGECDPEMGAYLDSVVRNTGDLDYITIADKHSIRVYHIDPQYIGQPFEGGDQYRALEGEAYLSDAGSENFEIQRRAFHPVLDAEGEVLGFVMASSTHHRLHQLRTDIYRTFWKLYLLLGIAALIFSGALAVYLRRMLRGVRPEDVLRMYLTQNDILNALDEGLVSYDNTGRVRLVNAAAARMLGRREDLLVGQQVDDLIRAENGESLRDRKLDSLRSNRANILVRPVQLPDSNLWARQVLILADKTETIRYVEELVGTRHMLSTLRATTHEFLNKLQVISGLLQMGQVRQAQAYIDEHANAHEHIVGPVMQLIRNPSVAALIFGKEHNMRELDISFALLRNSQLPERSRYLESEELVTVVGNLLENAMEAVNAAAAGGMRAVVLQITEDDSGLLLMVSDTGEGILEEDLPHIFEYGFSTKARSGRGIGMKLVKDIADRRGGAIEVDTEPGSGTTISVIFGRKKGELP